MSDDISGAIVVVRYYFARCTTQYPSNRCQNYIEVYTNVRVAHKFEILERFKDKIMENAKI